MTRNNADFRTSLVPIEEIGDIPHGDRTLADSSKDSVNQGEKYDWKTLTKSISENGITKPLVVNVDEKGNKTLIDGHHRYLTARELGLTHVPVVHVTGWQPAN